MPNSSLPPNEARRLETLHGLEILDTPPEKEFDDVVRLACEIGKVPFALVSFVDAERQWFKANAGLDQTETPRDVAFCAHAILGDDLFVVEDALLDERFRDNPLVIAPPKIRFYAGAPVHAPNGERLGTLCLLDRVPRVLQAEQREALSVLRGHVETVIALRQRNAELRRASTEVERIRVQKDLLVQFVAHDMKNALSSIMLNAEALVALRASHEASEIGTDILDATRALDRLVFDMLDLSRSERGADLRVNLAAVRVEQVTACVLFAARRVAATRRITITTSWADVDVLADTNLLIRVVENLLDNALRASPSGSEVALRTVDEPEGVRLTVTDRGPGIADENRERIFSLYEQTDSSDRRSRGIGLAFCRVAAAALGGSINAGAADGGGTTFCVTLRRR
jgi:signal transduction histidine kinase